MLAVGLCADRGCSSELQEGMGSHSTWPSALFLSPLGQKQNPDCARGTQHGQGSDSIESHSVAHGKQVSLLINLIFFPLLF